MSQDNLTYAIKRFFQRPGLSPITIRSGLTLEEAKAHCADPNTSSKTATRPECLDYTVLNGPWFDGYEEEYRRE